MSKCLECGKENPPATRRPRKYCSKICAKNFDSRRRYKPTAKEGYGDKFRKMKERRAELQREYRDTIEDGWINYTDLVEVIGLTKYGIAYRMRRTLIEGEETKRVHDGTRGAGGWKRFVSPEGVRKLIDYQNVEKLPLDDVLLNARKLNKEYNQREDRKAKNRERQRKLRECPRERLRRSVSFAVGNVLKIRNATKNGGKTFSNLPYTPEQLCAHIESQFDEHMTWDNYGPYWALDHIIPQAALPYDSMEHPNFVKCWALENLQPLEKGENARKSSYYEGKKYSWK